MRAAAAGGHADEIQLRIDPIYATLMRRSVTGLRKQVPQLRNVAQEIESEAKFQIDFLNQLRNHSRNSLASMMAKFRRFFTNDNDQSSGREARKKNNTKRLNKSIIREGSIHVMHVVLFALLCIFVVYLWSKFFQR